MKDMLEALFKFGSEFTWRKLLALILLGAVAFGIFLLYERYTSSFRLSRLQKASDLLIRLQEIEVHRTNSTPELERARIALMTQAAKAIEESPLSLEFIPMKLTFSVENAWKFLAGGALWCVIAVFQLSKLKTKSAKDSVLGFLMLAGLSGFVGVFVPAIWWPWFHILIYPWLFIAAVGFIAVPVALFISNFKSAKNKAQRNACIYNLKQIDGARQQWALENHKTSQSVPTVDDILPYLKNGVFPQCPSGGTYELESVSADPTCTVVGHSLEL